MSEANPAISAVTRVLAAISSRCQSGTTRTPSK